MRAFTREEASALPPDAMLTRIDTAAALTAIGFPTSLATLNTYATRGGGPKFHKYGARSIHQWGESLAWARGRLSAARRSTSEGDTAGGSPLPANADGQSDASPRAA